MIEIISLIAKIRKEKKISQKEMADKIGISITQYNFYENLKSIMNLKMFLEVLSILEIDTRDFFNFNISTKKKLELDIKKLFSENSNITKKELTEIKKNIQKIQNILSSK